MAMGRPSKYKPEFCQKALELMSSGASKYELCLEFFISEQTLYRWIDEKPDFREAIKMGSTVSQGWWEKQGRENIGNKCFNSTLWYMNMKNRFGWKDRQDVQHSGKVETEISSEDRRRIINELEQKRRA